jgi:plasmid stabilization system protein ParE
MPARYRVILSPLASADLADIHDHIAKDSPQSAASVVAGLTNAVDRLQHLPNRHPVYPMRGRPAAEIVRRMPVPPYLIYYRVDDARHVVEVITIRHGKRRPPKSFP